MISPCAEARSWHTPGGALGGGGAWNARATVPEQSAQHEHFAHHGGGGRGTGARDMHRDLIGVKAAAIFLTSLG
jgi:hypothetical protein